MNVLLAGIVGSTAYGLAGPDSDVDHLGVYAAPTVAFHGLHPPTGKDATLVRHDPDSTLHEAAKAADVGRQPDRDGDPVVACRPVRGCWSRRPRHPAPLRPWVGAEHR
jgi:hypothetical protein